MENVESFVDQLIEEKGYSDLDDNVRAELRNDMVTRLLDQIDMAAINALPEDKAIELADKIDNEDFDDDKVMQYIQDSGVDLQQVALETMLQFRMLYLGETLPPANDEAATGADESEADDAAEPEAAEVNE
jgi:Arc/MetJ-type ribon-helix-helix transcriptional regulator